MWMQHVPWSGFCPVGGVCGPRGWSDQGRRDCSGSVSLGLTSGGPVWPGDLLRLVEVSAAAMAVERTMRLGERFGDWRGVAW